MNALRLPLILFAGLAVFAGCGGLQPIGGPGVTPATTIVTAPASPSWMRRGAERADLLYVATFGSGVKVYTYPQGKLVGVLSNIGGAIDGECVDGRGNVFVTDQQYSRIDVFAHGRVGKIRELHTHRTAPVGCAVDPTTGNLAATGFSNRVNIFKAGQGEPVTYKASKSYVLQFCSYDEQGNLFANGWTDSGKPILVELPKGSHTFVAIKLDAETNADSGIQWDGKYLAMGAYGNPRKSRKPVIYRFALNGKKGTRVGTTDLGSPAQEFLQFVIYRKTIIIPNLARTSSSVSAVLIYKYPAGGAPMAILSNHVDGYLHGVVVSLAQK